jgi:hypothetical protein
VDSGKLKGREFKIVRFETTLGKAATNDVVLTDDWLLAKKQAIILRKGNDEFEIQDLGGLRRVKVNGKVIDSSTPLRTGDKLELGGTRLVFFSTAVDHPSTPAQLILKDAIDPEREAELEKYEDAPATKHPATPPYGIVQSAQREGPEENLLDPAALIAREESAGQSAGGRQLAPAMSAASNGAGAHAAAAPAQRTAAPQPEPKKNTAPPERVAPAPAQERRENPTPSASHESKSEIKAGASDKEVQMWESALNNPSPAIRKQAARMLKKLTGRDYDI